MAPPPMNQYMGGVDLCDMLVSLYRINIRSKKYYMKIIFHLIDLSIVNSWLLYRRYCSQFRLPKNEILSLLQFRIKVAEALLKSVVPKHPAQRGRPTEHIRLKENHPSEKSSVRPPRASIRFDGFDHWPVYTTKGRCRYPKCDATSSFSCSKCELRLCLNARTNCFKAYHHKD